MKMNRAARQIAPALLIVLAPFGAMAQVTVADTERAGAEAWFRNYIEPGLKHHWDDMSIEAPPVLYDPNEAAPVPGRIPMDRAVYRHQAEFGSYRGVVLAGDLPPTRAQRVDVQNWNDIAERTSNAGRAEMFRFYLEPVEPTPPLCRAIIP